MQNQNKLKIAIAGAGGFLGAASVKAWLNDPRVASVRGLYRSSQQIPRDSNAKLETVVGDLSNASLAEKLVRGVDVVVHFASHGFPSDPVPNPTALVSENLGATESLVRAMEKQGVRKILYASTGGGLYRAGENRVPLDESAAVELRSPYALYKMATEQLLSLHSFQGRIDPLLVRLSNPYGPGQLGRSRQGFFGVAFQKAVDGTAMPLWGSLETCKDFIFIDDTIDALGAFLWSRAPQGLYNLGSGAGTTLKEGLDLVQKITGVKLRLEAMPAKSGDTTWTILDITKTRKATGWAPKTSLEAGLTATWEAIQRGLKKAA